MKMEKDDRLYSLGFNAWIDEMMNHLRDVRCTRASYEKSIELSKKMIAASDIQEKVSLERINSNIQEHNKWRKSIGLKPLKLKT